MEILSLVWTNYLYVPLFNLLVWLYNNYATYSMGVAVILLTIGLRICLLPFSILEIRREILEEDVKRQVKEIAKDFPTDPIARRRAIRALLKKKSVKPWAKAIVLTVQAIIFFLLYQVFITGINAETNLHLLYSSVLRPDFINTHFLWFTIDAVNLPFTGLVAAYLFAEIFFEQNILNDHEPQPRDHIFMLLFPAFSFLILSFLPAVKSIFILTSLIFSSIIQIITAGIKKGFKQAKKAGI